MERVVHDELVKILPGLRSWARRYGTRSYNAEDLLADTIVSFLENPQRYQPDKSSLLNYLFSAIRNRACSNRRLGERKHYKRFLRNIRHDVVVAVQDSLRIDRSPENLDSVLAYGMSRMSARVATAFQLYADGKSCREIAEIMGVSRANVRSMVYRARLNLRACLSA